MNFLVIPIMVLNFVAGILGGIWLAFLGQWGVILAGFALMMGGAFLVSILLLPSMIFMMALLLVNEKLAASAFAMVPLALLSITYTYCIMGLWAVGIFWYFSNSVSTNAMIPAIFWSYSIATSVWNYLAQKDAQSGNNYAAMTSFFNQIGCVSLMIYTYENFHHVNIYSLAIWFSVPMAVGLVVHVAMVVSSVRAGGQFQ